MPGAGPAYGWVDNTTPAINAVHLEAMRDDRLSSIVDTPENHGAVRDGTTDDTTAIKNAIAAVVTAGISNGSYYGEVWFSAGTYAVKGSLDTSQSGSAQIPIPIISTTSPKFTLVLRARGYAATPWHWHQTSQQPCTLYSTGLTGTGQDGIIGGPISSWTDPNGTPSFSNMQLVLDGLTIAATHDCGLLYVDARHIGNFNAINGLTLTTERTAASHSPAPSASNNVGVYFPNESNNDNNGVDNLVCYDLYYGFAFADHFRAQRIMTIYCTVGGYMSDGQGGNVHGAYIDYWSCEGGGTVLQSGGGATTNFPFHVGRCDVEVQSGTYDIDDSNNNLHGHFGWAENSGAKPKTHGCANLEIIDYHQALGSVSAPTVPATTVALVNPFWRNAGVSITAGSSTCTVAIDGTTQLVIPAAGVECLFVPTGKTITLTYTNAPTWKWVLL